MQSIVAKRYAKAFWKVATPQDKAEIGNWMQDLIALFADKNLRQALTNPTIALSCKLAIVQDLLGARGTQKWLNFFQLCLQNRPGELSAICQELYNLYAQENHIQSVTVRVAAALTPGMQQAVLTQLASQLPADTVIQLKEVIDPAILGGLIIELGNRALDLSASQVLKNIQKRLISN